MPSNKAAPASKRQRLTLAQLAAYDDILTDALVDHVFYWTSVPKNRSSYHPSRGIREDVLARIIQQYVIVERDMDAAQEKLLSTDGLRRFHDGLKTEQERDDFRRHLRRYLQIYSPDCPWEVGSTNRYTIVTHEACVTARRSIRRNESIKYLSGIQVNITPEEEKEMAIRKKDFSIVVSSRSKCTSLFMGPARFANHDCSANARLMTTGQAGIEIIATQAIEPGEEITVSYGDNYFGEDNCECLCRTCEKNLRNGWKPEKGVVPTIKASVEGLGEDLDEDKTETYSFRRRPRDRSSTGTASSRTPSVAPTIRPRIYKTRPKNPLGIQAKESSTAASPTPEAGTPRGRKRAAESMVTPPVTPAKRLCILVDELIGDTGTTSDSSVSGRASSSGDAAETEVTTPENESPEPNTAKLTMREEGHLLREALPNIQPASPQRVREMQTPPLSQGTLGDAIGPAPVTVPSDPQPSIQAQGSTVLAVVESIETVEQDAKISGETLVATQQPARRKKYQRRVFIKQTTPPARCRTPGDYVLTPLLLSEPEMAWIQCMNCTNYFVQQNAYFTRASCPRCERHSKLYGYVWPKTEKAGSSDKEERILDHRTVHRFLDSHAERRVRNRKSSGWNTSEDADDASSDSTRGRKAGKGIGKPTMSNTAGKRSQVQKQLEQKEREAQREAEASGLRRSGRMRRASCKLVD
ncbi:hypothetical protein HIM_05639 [Hirsutella minnesotensis 3608]|uniref:Histone-lysine N-methyltransferase SET9 n=1 Tax=Hirsutella minnesotensis 3608 TaxID=1043627 RepID=A0A0F7ZUI2_9HYPO|nr:hypothetical protein HIM_05639 [Hirsutella minnesotensis 3608]